ncbi:MAG TPA: ATP-binding protein [Vicinamibacterales bacterium]|nr:ATP-binding protein [Vicinamibacterales bacterium]
MSEGASNGDLLSRVRELERLGRFQQDLHELILSVTRSLSSTLNLPASLVRLCQKAAPLFGARRVAAWIHDRRARELVLQASSDASPPEAKRMPLLVAGSPLAGALRRDKPEFITHDGVRALAVPLRGRRRALGVLLFEGLEASAMRLDALVDGAAELGRQLSSAIENTVLFEDVLRSRRELENTFNSLADLVIVCDRHLRVTNANRAFRERVAPLGGQPVDRPVVELIGPALAAWVKRLDLSGAAPPHDAHDVEDAVLGGHFAASAAPLHGSDRSVTGVVLVLRDRTQEVRLEAERAALDERLAQAEKLVALGQFVAGVAHELNNPLQGVLGHVELLRATRRIPRTMQSELRMVHREADRAARIVNNLLVFAGSRRAARRRINLNAVVTRTASLRARTARRNGIEITRELTTAPLHVRGDAVLIQQALLNVIVNAEHAIADAGTTRGRIRIATRREKGGALAVVEVADNGPGIRADILPRIFEPFFTTKEVGKGTGLGLALAYGIVQEHGGEIAARNAPRGGAVFRIALPADTMESRR